MAANRTPFSNIKGDQNLSSHASFAGDQNLTSSLSDGRIWNLSSQCLSRLEKHLECYARNISDNISELICEPKEGDSGVITTRIYATFLLVTAVTATLAIVLNLGVFLTICLSKQLHTTVNYLVSLSCVNQLLWAFLPIIEAYDLPVFSSQFCAIRYILFFGTGSMNFALIVTFTLLRYLLVVRNHRYPPKWQNLFLFTIIPMLPSVAQIILLRAHTAGKCGTFFATTLAGYVITKTSARSYDAELRLLIIIECIAGFSVVFFCYFRIFAKIVTSRRRVLFSVRNSRMPAGTPRSIANETQRVCSRFTGRLWAGQPANSERPAASHSPSIQVTTVHLSRISQRLADDTAVTRQPVSEHPTTSQETALLTIQQCSCPGARDPELDGSKQNSSCRSATDCEPDTRSRLSVAVDPCTPGPSGRRGVLLAPSALDAMERPTEERSARPGAFFMLRWRSPGR